jgi:hypothetical protein
VYKDRNVVEQLVRRAERAGFKAIALTVDTPRLGRREADIKNRSVLRFPRGLDLPDPGMALSGSVFLVVCISGCSGQRCVFVTKKKLWLFCRFVLPPYLTLKNFEGLNIGKMDQVCDLRVHCRPCVPTQFLTLECTRVSLALCRLMILDWRLTLLDKSTAR